MSLKKASNSASAFSSAAWVVAFAGDVGGVDRAAFAASIALALASSSASDLTDSTDAYMARLAAPRRRTFRLANLRAPRRRLGPGDSERSPGPAGAVAP